MANSKYEIHPWKVQFVDAITEITYQERKFLSIRRGLIVFALVMLAFFLLNCFIVLNPFPEDIELKNRTGYDTAMNEDLPQAVINLAMSLLSFAAASGWGPIKKNYSSLILGLFYCTLAYFCLIIPLFMHTESSFEFFRDSEGKYIYIALAIFLPIICMIIPYTFIQFSASLLMPLVVMSYMIIIQLSSVLLVPLIAISLVSGMILTFIKYRIEKGDRIQFARIHEIEQELEHARKMQMSLIPKATPDLPLLEISGRNIGANEVGGDFFNYFVAKDKIRIAVADVSGKGLKAAMNAVMACGILKIASKSSESPVELMSEINGALCDSMEQDMNMTMVLGEFDLQGKKLILANAGQHAYPLLVRNNQVEPIKAKGLALGMMPSIRYNSLKLDLKSGDLLLFMTDGITEPRNEEGKMYEESGRFHRLISNLSQDLSAKEIVGSVIDDVLTYMIDPKDRDDDITLVAVKVN